MARCTTQSTRRLPRLMRMEPVPYATNRAFRLTVQRTYFIHGPQVEHVRHAQGHSLWICDCGDYVRSQLLDGELKCEHVRRVAAAQAGTASRTVRMAS